MGNQNIPKVELAAMAKWAAENRANQARSRRVLDKMFTRLRKEHPDLDEATIAKLRKYRHVSSEGSERTAIRQGYWQLVYDLWESRQAFQLLGPMGGRNDKWFVRVKPLVEEVTAKCRELLAAGFRGSFGHLTKRNTQRSRIIPEPEPKGANLWLWHMGRSLGTGKGNQHVWLCYDRDTKKLGYTDRAISHGLGYHDTDHVEWLARAVWVNSSGPIVRALEKPRQKEQSELSFLAAMSQPALIKLLGDSLRPEQITRLANRAKKIG